MNVGTGASNYPLTEHQELNEVKYDVIEYKVGEGKDKGFCASVGKAIKAIHETPTCVKVMGVLGVLCLVGSSISAYTAYQALQKTCSPLNPDGLKPNTPPTQLPTNATIDVSQAKFNEIFPQLPVVVVTAQQAEITVRGDHDGHHNKCFINGSPIYASSNETTRTGVTGQPVNSKCRQSKFDLRADVTNSTNNCELESAKIGNFYNKRFELTERCEIYDFSGINDEINTGLKCINLPKTPSDARKALHDLGLAIGNRLKQSPNFKDNNVTESELAFEQIQTMADSFDEHGLEFNLGSSLRDGFTRAMRDNDPEKYFTAAPTLGQNTTTAHQIGNHTTGIAGNHTTDIAGNHTTNGTNNVERPLETGVDGKTLFSRQIRCTAKDPELHKTTSSLASGLGAFGFIAVFGAILCADFKKANVTVKIGVPKNKHDAMVLSYNHVSHYYNFSEVTFGNNFSYDLVNLVKFLMDKGEDVGNVYELALEVCDKVDARTQLTTHGDRAMNCVRAFMRENHKNDFVKYLVDMGIEEPERKDSGCWFTSWFNWGSSPQVRQSPIYRGNDQVNPDYSSIPMTAMIPEPELPAGASTPKQESSVPSLVPSSPPTTSAGARFSMGVMDFDVGSIDIGESMSSLTDGTYGRNDI